MNILALTNLFPSAWDPLRASFNRQQFDRLARVHDLQVMVAVDFRDRRRGRRGDPPPLAHARTADFTFWYPPRIGRSLHGLAWYASLMAPAPMTPFTTCLIASLIALSHRLCI